MLAELALLFPKLELYASVLDAERRAAEQRSRDAQEEARSATERSSEADNLLITVRAFLDGTSTEVPL